MLACSSSLLLLYIFSGEPTVCKHKSASLTLAGCLLEDKGIDYSVLHLNDESCKGEMNNLTHMVTFNFNSRNTCGTVIVVSITPLTIFDSIEANRKQGTIEVISLPHILKIHKRTGVQQQHYYYYYYYYSV